MKLRSKILLLVIGILIISLGTLSLPIYWYTRSALEEELDQRLLNILEITERNMNTDLVAALVRESSLESVRISVEDNLRKSLVGNIRGIILYAEDRTVLASTGLSPPGEILISNLLDQVLNPDHPSGMVSGIYELSDGESLKAATRLIDLTDSPPAVLVGFGGVSFLGYIDQLAGTIFWIGVMTLLVAVALTLAFSGSLIAPVQKLARYAHAIQENLYTRPVHLDRNDEIGQLNDALVEMHNEIKENEKQTKQLLSGIAHEIKNPLGGMEIYTGLLREEFSQDTASATYLEKTITALRNLSQTVTSYLDYARPVKSEPTRLSVTSVLEDVMRILQPELRQKRVQLASTGDGVATADESKLRRVFLNLLQNALQAVPAEKGQIRVEIQPVDEDRLQIRITDNGVGISEEDMERIFHPYFTSSEKGHGLGLPIVKNILDELNGSIFVESEVGEGTTMTVFLPGENHDA